MYLWEHISQQQLFQQWKETLMEKNIICYKTGKEYDSEEDLRVKVAIRSLPISIFEYVFGCHPLYAERENMHISREGMEITFQEALSRLLEAKNHLLNKEVEKSQKIISTPSEVIRKEEKTNGSVIKIKRRIEKASTDSTPVGTQNVWQQLNQEVFGDRQTVINMEPTYKEQQNYRKPRSDKGKKRGKRK